MFSLPLATVLLQPSVSCKKDEDEDEKDRGALREDGRVPHELKSQMP